MMSEYTKIKVFPFQLIQYLDETGRQEIIRIKIKNMTPTRRSQPNVPHCAGASLNFALNIFQR